ncbi:lethal(2)neighbour of tid protein [Schistocerca nitens]|uniref:lethal(2)neighbour of tid protein n=1 Tax=Schistocerca nitens TaxID=7011 RepID=UPI0021183F8A|nr:lethal(2)neighbour of tid protein [Schistocerca nitens]
MPSKGMGQSQKHRNQAIKLFHAVKNKYCTKDFVLSLVFDPKRLPVVGLLLIVAEIFVNIVVIHTVRYTEIDWVAYMQEVEGVANGTLDYTYLKGDTGPLVYPAGFVYIFMLLYYITEHGQNIRLAQYIFALFYIILLCLVFRIYYKSQKVPPYVLILVCCTSYRIHSIFVLRLFNDPVAMILLYGSLNYFLDNRWTVGSIFYSLAVSVKMNILLFAPALLVGYLTSLGVRGTIVQLFICASVQIILGLPFILTNPFAYIKGAFNLGRVFLFEWTVNWRFLPENIFISPYFHISLLMLHIALLAYFYDISLVYLRSYASLKALENDIQPQLKKHKEKIDMKTVSQLFLLPMFTSNFIGIMCSRSLHYQFYVWYFHSLPYLLWSTPFSDVWRLCILGVIELCWNTFPSTAVSSVLLHLCHICILYGLQRNKVLRNQATTKTK